MATKQVYWAAYFDRAYEDVYRPHSSTDIKKLVNLMVDFHKERGLGDDVIVLSKSRISVSSSRFFFTKAGTESYIGHIEIDGKPVFYNRNGKKTHLYANGRLII